MFDALLNFCAPTASKSETPAILEMPRLTPLQNVIEAVTLNQNQKHQKLLKL